MHAPRKNANKKNEGKKCKYDSLSTPRIRMSLTYMMDKLTMTLCQTGFLVLGVERGHIKKNKSPIEVCIKNYANIWVRNMWSAMQIH